MKHDLRRQILSTFGAEGIVFVFSLAFSILMSRALLPAGRGLFAAMWSTVSISVSIAGLGFAKALISRFNIAGEAISPRRYTGAYLVSLPAMILLGLAAAWLVVPDPPREERGVVLALTGLLVVAVMAFQLGEGVLRAHRRIYLLNAAQVGRGALRLFALVACLALGFANVPLVLGVELASWVLVACVVFWPLLRERGLRPEIRSGVAPVAALFKVGVVYHVYSIIWIFQARVDVLLLQHMADSTSTGYFVTGTRLAEMLWRVPTLLNFVVIPHLAAMEENRRALERTALLSRLGFIGLAVAGLLLGLAAGPLVALLYGDAFLPSVRPLQVILPGIVAAGLFQLAGARMYACGEVRPLIVCGAAGLAVNLILNFLLIPLWAENGAAAASTVSYTLTYTLLAVYMVRTSHLRLRDFLVPTRKDLSILLPAKRAR